MHPWWRKPESERMTSEASIPSVKKNYLYNTLLNFSNILFPLISFTYVSRTLGPANFGKVVFASSFVGYFLLLACLGIPIYGSREIARVRNDRDALSRLFSELFFINLCSTMVSLLLFLAPLFCIGKLRQETALFLVTGSMIVTNFFSVDWLFQGLENYRNITIRSLCFKTLALVMLFMAVRHESDYLWYAAMSIISTGGSNFVGFLYSRKYVRLRFARFSVRAHIKPIIIISSATLTVCIYIYLDSVMLGFLAGDRAVGLYSAAAKITRTVVVAVTSLNMVMIPRISYYLRNGLLKEYRAITQKSIHFILFLACPLSVGLFLLAPDIVAVFAGRQFIDAVAAIHILAPIIVIIGVSNFYSLQILYPNGEEGKLFIAVFCAAVVDVVCNLALIPLYSYKGTAVASVAAELTALILFILLTKKHHKAFRLMDRPAFIYLSASMVMGGVMYAVIRCLHNPIASITVSFLTGTLLYTVILFSAKEPITREIVCLFRTKGFAGIRMLFK